MTVLKFSENLKKLREARGFSQRALAMKLGAQQTSVYLWETTSRTPDILAAADIADVFGVTLDDLVGRTPPLVQVEAQTKPFGEIIKEKRTARHWTQPTLAEFVGVSSSNILAWEKGDTIPMLASFVRLADVFNCSLDELLGRRVRT